MIHYNFESNVPHELTEAFDSTDINAVNEMEKRLSVFYIKEKKDANHTAIFVLVLLGSFITTGILIQFFI